MVQLSTSTTLTLHEPLLLDPPVPPPLVNPVDPGNVWSATKSADPTDAGNWSLNHVPKSGDTVSMFTNVMYLKGGVLDGTDFHLGYDGPARAPPDPVLDLLGGSNLKVTVNEQTGAGNNVTINAFGTNTIDLRAIHDHHSPVRGETATVNVQANAVLTGHLDIYGAHVVMNGADHAAFDNEGTSTLAYAGGAPVQIMPDMIGTGSWNMAFSNLEVGGYVAPTQTFNMQANTAMTIDHVQNFHGTVDFLPGSSNSVLTLAGIQVGSYAYDGHTVTITAAGVAGQPLTTQVAVGVGSFEHNTLVVDQSAAGAAIHLS
jgi:hypothetical protein